MAPIGSESLLCSAAGLEAVGVTDGVALGVGLGLGDSLGVSMGVGSGLGVSDDSSGVSSETKPVAASQTNPDPTSVPAAP